MKQYESLDASPPWSRGLVDTAAHRSLAATLATVIAQSASDPVGAGVKLRPACMPHIVCRRSVASVYLFGIFCAAGIFFPVNASQLRKWVPTTHSSEVAACLAI